jgi:betaine-aldehyde dehydrogenase
MSGAQTLEMTIGGRGARAISGRTLQATNPATGELLASIPAADAADIERAVEVAEAAFVGWSTLSPLERATHLQRFADVIQEHAEELVALDVAENGTPIREMRGDVAKAIGLIRRFAAIALEAGGRTIPGAHGTLNYTLRHPYGVVARILPFNHPFMFAAGKLAAPLIAGNSLILKPSEATSLSTLRLGELSRGVLPDGVLNVVTGTGAEAGAALVAHPKIRRLAFIGSVATGRRIQADAAAVNVKHVSLELGGKNPLVIMPGTDPDVAAAAAVDGMNFTWQGQSCGSTSRLLVHEDLYETVLERVAARLGQLRIGDPTDTATDVGSLVTAAQLEKVLHYIELGQAGGARLVFGGAQVTADGLDRGNFIQPTLFADVAPDSRLAQEEIFGPVLSAMPFRTYEEALQIANSVEYGLTASIFTDDLALAHRFARDVEAGYVWVNEVSKHIPGTGFGGIKDSGLGRDEDLSELLSYTESKNVHVKFG